MRCVTGPSLQTVWLHLLDELLHRAEHHPAPRGAATREILGVTLRINDLRNNIIHHPARNLNIRFAVAEWLFIAMGREDVASLAQYNGQLSRFSDDGVVFAGAYGPRLASQWAYVIETLRKDPDSRQAVASIWMPNPAPSKDIPCTIALQFIAREGKLNVIVTMRSSDVWLGLPYDVFTFAMLANGIAGELGLESGWIQMQLASSHLYEDNVERAKEILAAPRCDGLRSPRLPGRPVYGLEQKLVDPWCAGELADPWATYARVLGAETWKEGYRLLRTLDHAD